MQPEHTWKRPVKGSAVFNKEVRLLCLPCLMAWIHEDFLAGGLPHREVRDAISSIVKDDESLNKGIAFGFIKKVVFSGGGKHIIKQTDMTGYGFGGSIVGGSYENDSTADFFFCTKIIEQRGVIGEMFDMKGDALCDFVFCEGSTLSDPSREGKQGGWISPYK